MTVRRVLSLLAAAAAACAGPDRGVLPAPVEPARADPPALAWEVIGSSVEGRPVEAVTLGDGPERVYLIAGIHGDERPAVENADRLRLFLEDALPLHVTVRLVRDANPDGTALGTRTNARLVDLNRNWPAASFRPSPGRGPAPLSEPETACVHDDLQDFGPDLVVVLHAARRGPFANFDGPGREAARRFAAAASAVDPRWYVEADMGYATPGSLGSYVGVDGGLPIVTVELDRRQTAEEAWAGLRAGIAAVLGGSPAPAPPDAYDVR